MSTRASGPPGRANAFVLAVVLALLIPQGQFGGAPAAASAAPAAGPADAASLPARSWLLADAGTGAILAARREHVASPPASTVKLMTAIVALERLPMGSTVWVSGLAAGRPAMKIGMKAGQVWPLADALHALLITSANDAAYALAEQASGSLDAFATAMNAEGSRLGMVDSTFSDPAGLDDATSFRGGSLVSAYDLAIAARNALALPPIAADASTREYRFVGPDGTHHVLHNHNDVFLEGYPGATGLKTGYTKRAGGTVVDTASRNGRTLVAVVLGAPDARGTARALLDAGFGLRSITANTARLPPVGAYLAGSTTRVADVTAARDAPVATAAPAASTIRPSQSLAVLPVATRGAPRRSGGISWVDIAIMSLALVVGLVTLRRRAVLRTRRTRAERRQALQRARRRGVLHVVQEGATASGRVSLVGSSGRPPRSHASR